MHLWVSFWAALASAISSGGLAAVASVVLLRSAGVPIPIPADLLVVLVGVEAREQQLELWPAWIVLTAATTIGAALLYVFVRWIGQDEVARYGHYVGLSEARLSAAEERLGERGVRAVFVARIVPGLRMAIVAVCGMLRFGTWQFLAAVICGALLYVGACLTIGYLFGPAISELVGVLVFPLGMLEPLLGLGILLFWLTRSRKRMDRSTVDTPLGCSSAARVGAMSGTLAIAGATMLVNALAYVVLPVIANSLQASASIGSLTSLAAGLGSLLQSYLDSIAAGIVLGVTYGVVGMHWRLEKWPDWLRGLLVAAVAFAMVVCVQALTMTQLDQPQTFWPTMVLGEAIRWGAYGVLLGLIYPVLYVRRAHAQSDQQGTGGIRITAEASKE